MEKAVERGPDWAGLPVIATVARLLCRELTLQNEYLRLENLWGYQRLPGELLKLRIILSKGCIADILEKNALYVAYDNRLAERLTALGNHRIWQMLMHFN